MRITISSPSRRRNGQYVSITPSSKTMLIVS